jgi:ABC-type thiamine transport system ATPase subunit
MVVKVVDDPKATPKLRERALFVLARSSAPEARQTVARFAEGGANPDLQIRALQYLAATDNAQNQDLYEQIYRKATDAGVKKAALQALFVRKQESALVQIARSESNPDLRREAIHLIGALPSSNALSGLYSSESNAEIKRTILDSIFAQGNAKELIAVARRESNPELKRQAVERLSNMKSKEASDYLAELLAK